MNAEISFEFEGRTLSARPGQSVAAALINAGIFDFRETNSGRRRGMFCGIGVCQDCLIEIDGRANQRACMAKVQTGATIRRQVALPELTVPAEAEKKPEARYERPDILVIGGGAGGLSAAIAARRSGATTLLLDDRRVHGGQYFKQTAAELNASPLDAKQKLGADLVGELRACGVQTLHGAEVWGAFAGPVFYADHRDGALIIEPKAAIVATGAYERPTMVPGWDLPRVMTTGAAQTLWRSYRTLPGRRIAVVGSGPLNAQVALELARGGAKISLLAESSPTPWSRPWAVARLFAAAPGLTFNGAVTLAHLWAAGAKQAFRTSLEKIDAVADGLRITIRSDDGPSRILEVDTVLMNHGFQPQNEILRLLGVRMDYEAAMDQLRPQRSDNMETSIRGVFAVGDCCGLGGAPAAMEEGSIAGAAAAVAAGVQHDLPGLWKHRRRLERHRQFQHLLWQIHDPRALQLENRDPDTIVCRCEEVTLAAIDAALTEDSVGIGSLKRATRLGMGRCQGRYCAPALAPYLARKLGRPVNDLSFFAPRSPIKPVEIAAILAAGEVPGDK